MIGSLASIGPNLCVKQPAVLLRRYLCDTAPTAHPDNKLYDDVSKTNNLTIKEVTLNDSTFKFGPGSIELNSPTDFIQVDNIFNFSSGVHSLTMWFKTSIASKNYVNLAIFSSLNSASNPYTNSTLIRIKNNSSIEHFVSINGVATFNSASGAQLTDNAWHHLSWVVGPNVSIVYIDNKLWYDFGVNNKTKNIVFNATGTGSRIGNSSWRESDTFGQDETLIGFIDDIQFYKGALTLGQINAIYNGNGA